LEDNSQFDAVGVLTAMSDGTVTVTASANDTSGISGSIEVDIINQSSGIGEMIAENNSIRLFPNPAHTFVKIEAQDHVEKVEVYTIQGKLIEHTSRNNGQLDIQELIPGIYLVRVLSGESWKTVRLVKE